MTTAKVASAVFSAEKAGGDTRVGLGYLAQFARRLRRSVAGKAFCAGRLAAEHNLFLHLPRFLLLLQNKRFTAPQCKPDHRLLTVFKIMSHSYGDGQILTPPSPYH